MDNVSQSQTPAREREEGLPSAEQHLRSEAEGVKKQAANLKREASERAEASLESAKTHLKEVAQTATDYGRGFIDEQKARLAEITHEYCRAAQAASEKLNQEGHSALASGATQLASRFDGMSAYLRERKPSEIYRDAEQFTRRRPEVIFGIVFAAGLLTARFLKASDHGAASDHAPDAGIEPSLSKRPGQASTIEQVSEKKTS